MFSLTMFITFQGMCEPVLEADDRTTVLVAWVDRVKNLISLCLGLEGEAIFSQVNERRHLKLSQQKHRQRFVVDYSVKGKLKPLHEY